MGAPDLIVEIISENNSKRDLTVKYNLYQDAGVPEYWIVFPNDKLITAYMLNGSNMYQQKGVYEISDEIDVKALPGFILMLSEVFLVD